MPFHMENFEFCISRPYTIAIFSFKKKLSKLMTEIYKRKKKHSTTVVKESSWLKEAIT